MDKIIQKVNEFDSKQQPSSAEEIINVLAQQIKMSETASGLSYTDPRFMEFVSQTELAEAIKDIDSQIAQAEADAKLEAEKAAKKKQEEWAKHHPVENFLQNMSDSIGDWWGNVVQGTKNLSIPKGFKDILLFGEGFLGGAGEMVSSVAIGGGQVIHLGVELVEWGLDSARGIETPQWKLDDIKGAWENTKAIGSTLKTIGLGLQGATNPWLLAVSPTHREALKETFDMGAGIVNTIVNDIKTGNAYAIGGYVFDVASMFVGVGEVNAALKGTKLATKIAEGLNAFKAASKTMTLSKLGKVTSMMDKALKYGDDALKAFATKLKNIPVPIMEEKLIAGTNGFGKVNGIGKGTLGDYMELAKSNFSKGIPSSEYKELRKKTPSKEIRKKVNPEGPKKDPVYGYEVDKFEADHIVSMKEITEMDGFNLLTKEEQIEILNLQENFVGLGKRTNASKGAHNWTDWKGHSVLGEVPADVRKAMLELEEKARESLKEAIIERLK
ncbi:hypothetical protein BCR22_02705 [Enterococcus plantarum]|nr:hypothetical protein BCR22_02705 [Enterococcus plantarum]